MHVPTRVSTAADHTALATIRTHSRTRVEVSSGQEDPDYQAVLGRAVNWVGGVANRQIRAKTTPNAVASAASDRFRMAHPWPISNQNGLSQRGVARYNTRQATGVASRLFRKNGPSEQGGLPCRGTRYPWWNQSGDKWKWSSSRRIPRRLPWLSWESARFSATKFSPDQGMGAEGQSTWASPPLSRKRPRPQQKIDAWLS